MEAQQETICTRCSHIKVCRLKEVYLELHKDIFRVADKYTSEFKVDISCAYRDEKQTYLK